MQGYTNDYSSTLAAGYTAGGTSLAVASAAGLPTSGLLFYLKVDDEYFLVTAWAGTTLTTVGARAGSSPSNHASGAAITGCWILPEVLDGIRADISAVGPLANLPTSGMKQGDRYKCSDSQYEFVYTGSLWQAFFSGFPVSLPPLASSLSWVNQGAAVANNTLGGLYIQAPIGGGDNQRMLVQSLPSPPWSVVAGISPPTFQENYIRCGLVLRDSGSGREFIFCFSPGGLAVYQYNSFSSYAGCPLNCPALTQKLFFKIRDDGANFVFSLSPDGVNWIQLWSVGRTSWLGNPDQLGVFADSNNGEVAGSCFVFHWLMGT